MSIYCDAHCSWEREPSTSDDPIGLQNPGSLERGPAAPEAAAP
jgi:hypothetical protein